METIKLTVGEQKYRAMVNDLMAKNDPQASLEIECQTSSKARSLRRMFYMWKKNLFPWEQSFMDKYEYKLRGRVLLVEPKLDWKPEESQNVPNSQGVSS